MLLTITNIWGLALVLNVALIAAETEDSTPEKVCICTKQYKPVCGSDNVTYGNECIFQCKNGENGPLKVVYNGSCEAYNCFRHIRGLPPTLAFCGTDGVTYPSGKALECLKIDHPEKEGVEVAHQGECKKVCICTKQYKPVCGSDNVTYSNGCIFKCRNGENGPVKIAYEGQCEGCVCTFEYKPVCGSDNVTYSNKCLFECENGKNGPVKIVYEGSCRAYNCFRSIRPYSPYHTVCGTDGVTYPSGEALECLKIDRPEKANVYVEYNGPCVRCDS